MDAFITHKRIGGLNVYRKPIVVAIAIALLFGIFAGNLHNVYASNPNEFPPELKELLELTNQSVKETEEALGRIKQLIKELDYSDVIAQNFANMVFSWQDERGFTVLFVWKDKLSEARKDYKQDKITEKQLVEIEMRIIGQLAQRVTEEIKSVDGGNYFDLSTIIKQRKAHCLGYTQLFYILGKEIGFIAEPIEVTEPMDREILIACLFTLSSGRKVIVVGGAEPVFISESFILEKEFNKKGNYWEQKKETQLLLRKRIRILDKNGLIAAIHNNKEIIYTESGQYERAIFFCKEAIRLDPESSTAYDSLGNVYVKLGEYKEALNSFKKAVELDSKNATAYHNLGTVYCVLGYYQQAIDFFERALEINPKYPEAYYNLGNAYAGFGKHKEGISSLQKAIELNPKLGDAYNALGVIYKDLGRYQEAVNFYKRAIEINPQNAEVYYNLGLAYIKLSKYEESLKSFENFLKCAPDSQYKEEKDEVKNQLISAYLKQGEKYYVEEKYEKAIEAYEKALKLDPNDARAYVWLGIVYELIGNHQQAIDFYQKAISINPKFTEAYNALGFYFHRHGKFEQAVDFYQKALETNPKFAITYLHLGFIYLLKPDKYPESLNCFENFLKYAPDDLKDMKEKVKNEIIPELKKTIKQKD